MLIVQTGTIAMKPIAFAVAFALPLAACNSEPEVSAENASAEDVAKQVRDAGGTASFVNPGKWRSTVTIEEMTMPGMPPEMAAQMKGFAGRTETHESCLSADEAKRPKEDFFSGGKNCRYDNFSMGNGRIDAVMKCKEDGATHTMTMNGTYSGDTYDMRMAMRSDAGEGADAGMTMKMRVEAKRVGQCTGKEKDA